MNAKFIFGLFSAIAGLTAAIFLVRDVILGHIDDYHWLVILIFTGCISALVYPVITRFWTKIDIKEESIKKENKILELQIEQKKLKDQLNS